MRGINCNGIFDGIGMIESVIVMLNDLEVKGVRNMKIIFDCINRLDALKQSLNEKQGDAGNVSVENGQG